VIHSFFTAVLAILIALLGLQLRVYEVGRDSLWFDEAVTALYTSTGAKEAWHSNLRDSTPPLYFVGLSWWRKFVPASEEGLRGYSIAWSMIGLGGVAWLGWVVGRSRAIALGALLLLAVNPLDIYYAREARPYAQAAAFCTLATCVFYLLFFRGTDRRPWKTGLLAGVYGVSCGGVLLTHYAAFAVPLAHTLTVMILWRRRGLDSPVLAAACALLAFGAVVAPWLVALQLDRGLNTSNAGWMAWPRWYEWFVFVIREFFWGVAAPSLVLLATSAVVCAVGLPAIIWQRRDALATTGFLLCCIAIPVLVALGAGLLLSQSVFAVGRFSVFLVPAFCVLLAESFSPELCQRKLRVVFFAAALLMFAGSLRQFSFISKPDWRGFAGLVRQLRPARIVYFPAYNATAANHYIHPDIQNFRLDQLITARPYMVGQEIWIVRESNFGLALQPGELQMEEALKQMGRAEQMPSPSGLYLERLIVR